MNQDEALCAVFQAIRDLQKRNNFVAAGHGSIFGLSEAHLVVEISADPHKSTQELAKIIGLEKSTVSRTIAFLVKRGFVRTTPAKYDARRRELSLTAKGSEALATLDKNANANVVLFSAPLTAQEQTLLCGYLKSLADGFAAAPSPLRPGEMPLRREVRRMSRAVGLLGVNFMESGLSSTQWQILSEIHGHHAKALARDLCAALRVSAATMSSALKRLEKLGLVSRSVHAEDKRSYPIELTAHGKKTLQNIRDVAQRQFAKALAALGASQLAEFVELFRRYVNPHSQRSSVLRERLEVRRIQSFAARQEARGFLLAELVRLGIFDTAPEILVGERSVTYGLFGAEKLQALCEVQERGKLKVLANFVTAPELDGSETARNFLCQALRSAMLERKWPQIALPAESAAGRALRDFAKPGAESRAHFSVTASALQSCYALPPQAARE